MDTLYNNDTKELIGHKARHTEALFDVIIIISSWKNSEHDPII